MSTATEGEKLRVAPETDEDREAIAAMNKGTAIDDLAAEEEEDSQDPQLVLPGTAGQKLSGSVGGKRPTSSEFKMASISLPISENQQLEKDTSLWVAVEVQIDQVGMKNHKKGRDIVAVVRTHTATPLSVQVLDGSPFGEEIGAE